MAMQVGRLAHMRKPPDPGSHGLRQDPRRARGLVLASCEQAERRLAAPPGLVSAMRVLVEQTESEVRSALQHIGLLWDGEGAS